VTAPIDRFIPAPDVRERFETAVKAPAPLVMDVAANMDMQSLPLVKAIIRTRELVMGSRRGPPRMPQGLLAEVRANGWGILSHQAGAHIVCGAACQPWRADVTFRSIMPEHFADWSEPDQVKIAWTLETDPLGPDATRFANETRVVATDPAAREKFLRYWRWARFGIIGIRLLLLPAVRRRAEERWKRENRSA
jgi:hypothetical protein